MKLSIFFTIFFLSCLFGKSLAQSLPAINNIEVNYRVSNQLATDTNGTFLIKVFPEATINLNSAVNISKIYFKISDLSDHSILYNVVYNINSPTITNDDGITLFFRNNNVIRINAPNTISLTTYSYELITEDTQGNLSTPFQEVH